jgi:hypothetical protein
VRYNQNNAGTQVGRRDRSCSDGCARPALGCGNDEDGQVAPCCVSVPSTGRRLELMGDHALKVPFRA